MILDSTLKLEAVLAGAVSANQPEVHIDYVEWNTANEQTRPATFRTALNSTTDVTILAAPTINPIRVPMLVSIYNKDTATVTVTVKTDDASTERIIVKATLLTLEVLIYDDGEWYALTASGGFKQGGVSGPGASTNNGMVRWDGTTGTAIKDTTDITYDGTTYTIGAASKFTVASASGNTVVAGTLGVTGRITGSADLYLPNGNVIVYGAGSAYVQGSSAANTLTLVVNSAAVLSVNSAGVAITGTLGVTGALSATGGKYFMQDSGSDMLIGNQSGGQVLIYRSGAQIASFDASGKTTLGVPGSAYAAAFLTVHTGANDNLFIADNSVGCRILCGTDGLGAYKLLDIQGSSVEINTASGGLTTFGGDVSIVKAGVITLTLDSRTGGNGGQSIQMLGWNTTNLNWRIDVAKGAAGLVFTPSTAAGGSTFTTPVATLSEAGGWTMAGAMTYGGVTLSNAVTGTGKMVLNNSPSLDGPMTLKAYTVATLPAGSDGMVAFVTDALAPTFLGALTGGSTTHVPVFYDGGASAWKSF